MKRIALLIALLAGCGGTADGAPDTLAMTDSDTTTTARSEPSSMHLSVGQETFELSPGICNTYEDGTFMFALGEGTIDGGGHVTATIERFDTGSGFEMIFALEGMREDGTKVSWYAQESNDIHEITSTVVGGMTEGSALFASISGPEAAGIRSNGSFSVSCQ